MVKKTIHYHLSKWQYLRFVSRHFIVLTAMVVMSAVSWCTQKIDLLTPNSLVHNFNECFLKYNFVKEILCFIYIILDSVMFSYPRSAILGQNFGYEISKKISKDVVSFNSYVFWAIWIFNVLFILSHLRVAYNFLPHFHCHCQQKFGDLS